MSFVAPMRCSALAEQLDEPMAGTVDQRRRWICVEDRSPWGEKAVRDLLGADLEARAKAAAIRLLLIRRREGDPAADAVRRVFVADTEAGTLRTLVIEDHEGVASRIAALLDADLETIGEPLTGPLFLVCTNGKRDACCALRGRALLAVLVEAWPAATWECTHLGGHRFAANLVCLPDGLVYGRVTPADGPRLAARYAEGRLDPAFLRGRSPWPAPAQVAEAVLRDRLGFDGVGDLTLVGVALEPSRATVELRAPDGFHRLTLVAEPASPPRPISCRADEVEEPIHWRVVAG